MYPVKELMKMSLNNCKTKINEIKLYLQLPLTACLRLDSLSSESHFWKQSKDLNLHLLNSHYQTTRLFIYYWLACGNSVISLTFTLVCNSLCNSFKLELNSQKSTSFNFLSAGILRILSNTLHRVCMTAHVLFE